MAPIFVDMGTGPSTWREARKQPSPRDLLGLSSQSADAALLTGSDSRPHGSSAMVDAIHEKAVPLGEPSVSVKVPVDPVEVWTLVVATPAASDS